MGALLCAVGDIHGRFARVESWLRALEEAQGRKLDLAVGVGDLETFSTPEAPLRKRSKRNAPAEFGLYARGERSLPCPLVFIGGNNEDFATLYPLAQGGPLAPGVTFLGRAGSTQLSGLSVAFLSGIFAPTSFEMPLQAPTNLDSARRAGHFRKSEVERVASCGHVDLLLLHDWPARISAKGPSAPPHFWGNPPARALVEALTPSWVLCGHQHRAWISQIGPSRIACLADAELPETGLCWLEIEKGSVCAVGWGISNQPSWRAGEPWKN